MDDTFYFHFSLISKMHTANSIECMKIYISTELTNAECILERR